MATNYAIIQWAFRKIEERALQDEIISAWRACCAVIARSNGGDKRFTAMHPGGAIHNFIKRTLKQDI